jgi:hypothetical protein
MTVWRRPQAVEPDLVYDSTVSTVLDDETQPSAHFIQYVLKRGPAVLELGGEAIIRIAEQLLRRRPGEISTEVETTFVTVSKLSISCKRDDLGH